MDMDFAEAMLHMPCTADLYEGADQLPLYLKGGYTFYRLQSAGIVFLAAEPTEQTAFSVLRKHRAVLEELTGMKCAFVLDQPSAYTKKKLIEAGIPFLRPGRELYLPFLGVVLTAEREAPTIEKKHISFLAQKLLLTVLYQNLRRGTAAELADLLGVSRMSVTRCMDEVETLYPDLIQRKGRNRCLVWEGSWRDYWATVRPILRSPVIKEYRLERPLEHPLPLGGISAVCHYTMLGDNAYPTYAATRARAKELGLAELPQVPRGEIPAALIQVVGYEIALGDTATEKAVDPLTAILSLDAEERNDPRVEQAIQKIEEEYIK